MSLFDKKNSILEEIQERTAELTRVNEQLRREIAERNRADEALKETNRFLENILDSSYSISIISTDLDKNILFWNKGAEEIFGYKAVEMVNRQKMDVLYSDEDTKELINGIKSLIMKNAKVLNTEIREKTKDGRTIWINLNLTPRFDEKGGVIGFLGIGEDITERKRAEEALQESEEKWRSLVENAPLFILIVDNKGMIQFINRVMFGKGIEELTGRSIYEFIHASYHGMFRKSIEQIAKTGKAEPIRFTASSPDGVILWYETYFGSIKHKGQAVAITLISMDITERRRMEEELIKTGKLESMSLLAGGIAHDFNNILVAILGNISLARLNMSKDDVNFEILAQAENASNRAKNLTHQLLNFTKGGATIKKTTSISELIKDSVKFGLRGSNVKHELSVPDDLWTVEVDEGQISQVINNFVINAKQAMPGGGVVKACAENITIGPESPLKLPEGEYIKVSIKDNGVGISKEHLKKIFDPFFTTKEKGNGLGLSNSYSIIKNHNGLIHAESELGIGTAFNIYLPVSKKERISQKEAEGKPVMGKGRVLVMDDDEMVRNVVGIMLEKIGYDPGFARGGTEAIQMYKEAEESHRHFDVVIMDLTIPGGMGAREAVKGLLEIYPDAKVIVSSGYCNDDLVTEFNRYGFCDIISKPYDINELSQKLNKLIMGKEQLKCAV
ncbi:PAS domain S-box protein [bacterium]|nr:PAS domain S-box protein [bacterium]